MQQPEPAARASAESSTPTLLTPPESDRPRWYHKATAVMGAVLCFELGLVLIIYPWLSDWTVHAAVLPVWSRPLWNSAWFRGAVTGLGVLDVYISVVEAFRLRRFSR